MRCFVREYAAEGGPKISADELLLQAPLLVWPLLLWQAESRRGVHSRRCAWRSCRRWSAHSHSSRATSTRRAHRSMSGSRYSAAAPHPGRC